MSLLPKCQIQPTLLITLAYLGLMCVQTVLYSASDVCTSPFHILNLRFFRAIVLARFTTYGFVEAVIELSLVYLFCTHFASVRKAKVSNLPFTLIYSPHH